jgi:hypothetical protein
MNTYLFLWNPKKWSWSTIEQDINQVDLNFEKIRANWSVIYKTTFMFRFSRSHFEYFCMPLTKK